MPRQLPSVQIPQRQSLLDLGLADDSLYLREVRRHLQPGNLQIGEGLRPFQGGAGGLQFFESSVQVGFDLFTCP